MMFLYMIILIILDPSNPEDAGNFFG